MLYKIKFKSLLKKLPERRQPQNDANDTNDIDIKEEPELEPDIDLSPEGTGPGMPPPAPLDATPGVWSGTPSPKIEAGPGSGMPPPNPLQNNPGSRPTSSPALQSSQSTTESSQAQPPPNPLIQTNHSYHAASPKVEPKVAPPINAVRKQNQSVSSVKSAPIYRPQPPARRSADNRGKGVAKRWPPVGHKHEYKDDGDGDEDNTLKDDLNVLKRKLVDFEKKYTETQIASMYNEDKGSIQVEKEIDELEVRMKASMEQLKCMKTQIIKLKVSNGVDVSQYESWSIDEMVVWICSLHNGRFKKYADKIRKGFTHNEISGAHMTLMNSSAIHEVCGITHWKDRNDLAECFSSLKAKK